MRTDQPLTRVRSYTAEIKAAQSYSSPDYNRAPHLAHGGQLDIVMGEADPFFCHFRSSGVLAWRRNAETSGRYEYTIHTIAARFLY